MPKFGKDEIQESAEVRVAQELKKCGCSHCRFIAYKALGGEAEEFLRDK
jgi:hypothetical protein